jgi:hypothetical protein
MLRFVNGCTTTPLLLGSQNDLSRAKDLIMTLLITLILALTSPNLQAIDFSQIEKDLPTKGIEGNIHGAAHGQGLYVFTLRNPTDFFDYAFLSLTTKNTLIQNQLSQLGRHDRVLVKGVLATNASPQRHIEMASLEVLKSHTSPYPAAEHSYDAKIPEDLLNKTEEIFLVHAIGENGHIVVVEYKDAVLPIFVKNEALTSMLSRNDIVKLNFKIQSHPNQPVHLRLNELAPKPLEIIEAVMPFHEKPADIEGALIFFPKSPEINQNVFAVQQLLQNGLTRQYTLVNFEDPAEFKKIRDSLQSAWDRHPGLYTNGRNKLVSTRIRVRAKGLFNQVDANQANVQILLKNLSSIQILE